tara:strand:- start:724 stop:996 length:273 start_codon:yes stop_codon:yes gene_type:complete
MPYIPNEEELAQQAAWKEKRKLKNLPLQIGFNSLTDKQQDTLRQIYHTMDSFGDEMRDLEGDCYHSTMQNVLGVYGKLRTSFPNLHEDED